MDQNIEMISDRLDRLAYEAMTANHRQARPVPIGINGGSGPVGPHAPCEITSLVLSTTA